MKERILSGWTFTRVVYLVVGIFIIVHSLMDKQWFGAAIGGYFASMGLFSFGCASGNCAPQIKESRTDGGMEAQVEEIEYEEIKVK